MGWKIYFWFITLLLSAATGLLMTDSVGILLPDEGGPIFDESWNWLDWLSIPITWIGIVGFFGFTYKKIIGEQNFWKRWLIFVLIFDISNTVYDYYPEGFVTEDMWFDILAYSLFIPYYVALYLYGYKSDSLWNPQPTPPQ